jgi:tRNA nucleotidyltransferase (CCA-adding enzyme)
MEIWPKQTHHENLGVPVIMQLCQRLTVPNRYQKLAWVSAQWHLAIHRVSRLSASEIVDVFTQTQALQDDTLFEKILLVCEADSQGRGIPSSTTVQDYRQAHDWRVLLAECRKITAQTFIAQGYTGPAIKDALHAARVACVALFRDSK